MVMYRIATHFLYSYIYKIISIFLMHGTCRLFYWRYLICLTILYMMHPTGHEYLEPSLDINWEKQLIDLLRTPSTLNQITPPMDCWSNLHTIIKRTGFDQLDMENIMVRTQMVIMDNIITMAWWLHQNMVDIIMTDRILRYAIGYSVKNSSTMWKLSFLLYQWRKERDLGH